MAARRVGAPRRGNTFPGEDNDGRAGAARRFPQPLVQAEAIRDGAAVHAARRARAQALRANGRRPSHGVAAPTGAAAQVARPGKPRVSSPFRADDAAERGGAPARLRRLHRTCAEAIFGRFPDPGRAFNRPWLESGSRALAGRPSALQPAEGVPSDRSFHAASFGSGFRHVSSDGRAAAQATAERQPLRWATRLRAFAGRCRRAAAVSVPKAVDPPPERRSRPYAARASWETRMFAFVGRAGR
jgi:hypothetical protein